MKILLARHAGFCMGVRRAIDLALAAARPGPVLTLGPLIHNPQAMAWLAERGVVPAGPEPLSDNAPPARVVIRAHGLPLAARERLAAAGHELIDATCPHVRANQEAIRDAARVGIHIYLAADPGHAETVGLQGQAPDGGVTLVANQKAAGAIAGAHTAPSPALLLAQTTFDRAEFRRIAAILRERIPGLAVRGASICRATDLRQTETRRLARSVDAVVVVGGRASANTKRLAEIAAAEGKPQFTVETAAGLDEAALSRAGTVAVVAGASTPDWITREVVDRLEDL